MKYFQLSFITLSLAVSPLAAFAPNHQDNLKVSWKRSNRALMRKDEQGSSNDGNSFGNLLMNAEDLMLLMNMRSRITTLPFVIIQGRASVILPGEKFEYSSDDPKFYDLIQRVLDESCYDRSIGLIGSHPMHKDQALSIGVTIPISDKNVSFDRQKPHSVQINGAIAANRFEVQDEPWLDENSKSFYWCHADVTERQEELNKEQKKELKIMADKIPDLVEQWLNLMVDSNTADLSTLRTVFKKIGPMPKFDDHFKAAHWIATLINNSMLQDVCMDIRAAMLSCRNNFDRINLAIAAIENSIRYLKTVN